MPIEEEQAVGLWFGGGEMGGDGEVFVVVLLNIFAVWM